MSRKKLPAGKWSNFWDGEELVRNQTNHIQLPADFPELVYLSFDLDGLDPLMPAVGTPVPGGLTYYRRLIWLNRFVGRTCVGMDLVELAPLQRISSPSRLLSPAKVDGIGRFCWFPQKRLLIGFRWNHTQKVGI